MPKRLEDDLWAMVEGTKAVLEKRSFKGGKQNQDFRGDTGEAFWRRQNLRKFESLIGTFG